jgi:hypothetical protein
MSTLAVGSELDALLEAEKRLGPLVDEAFARGAKCGHAFDAAAWRVGLS